MSKCHFAAQRDTFYVKGTLCFLAATMPFQVEPASYADLDILADVLVKAHANDKLFQQLFPRVPHEVRVTWYADAFRKTWEKKWMRYYKVVDVETRSVSFPLL